MIFITLKHSDSINLKDILAKQHKTNERLTNLENELKDKHKEVSDANA